MKLATALSNIFVKDSINYRQLVCIYKTLIDTDIIETNKKMFSVGLSTRVL